MHGHWDKKEAIDCRGKGRKIWEHQVSQLESFAEALTVCEGNVLTFLGIYGEEDSLEFLETRRGKSESTYTLGNTINVMNV